MYNMLTCNNYLFKTHLCLSIQLRMVISFQNDSINDALYNCNWTGMSIKFKKLLLLTMQINNANNFKLNISTNIIINLQLYTNVCKHIHLDLV